MPSGPLLPSQPGPRGRRRGGGGGFTCCGLRGFEAYLVVALVGLVALNVAAFYVFGHRALATHRDTLREEDHHAGSEKGADEESHEKSGGGRSHPPCSTVLFFHVPKTGGTTMGQEVLARQPGYMYFNVRRAAEWAGYVESLATIGKPLRGGSWKNVIELHLGSSPTIAEARPAVERLRREYVAGRGCRLTAFAMLRDPLRELVSTYNHVCRTGDLNRLFPWAYSQGTKCGLIFPRSKASFFAGLRQDVQASYLLRGWQAGWVKNQPAGAAAVSKLAQDMEATLDFVGVTEEFGRTVDLLVARAGLRKVTYQVANDRKGNEEDFWAVRKWLGSGKVSLDTLQSEEVAVANASQAGDWQLYHRFRADFERQCAEALGAET